METIQVVERASGALVPEPVLGGAAMRRAYHSAAGRLIRTIGMRTGLASRLLGWYCDSRLSRGRIRPFAERLGIDLAEVEGRLEDFATFNDFFTRRLAAGARPAAAGKFASPADARLTVIPDLAGDRAIPVKGCSFSLPDLLGDRQGRHRWFAHGTALVFRLCPADYHRYHYPDSGRVTDRWSISGRYDSVHPIALASGLPIFTENRREISLLELDRFGPAAFVEVGAFGVGGVVHTHRGEVFAQLDEVGFFKYGASTIVVLLTPNRLRVDGDLVEASDDGLEVLVRAGERLGTAP